MYHLWQSAVAPPRRNPCSLPAPGRHQRRAWAGSLARRRAHDAPLHGGPPVRSDRKRAGRGPRHTRVGQSGHRGCRPRGPDLRRLRRGRRTVRHGCLRQPLLRIRHHDHRTKAALPCARGPCRRARCPQRGGEALGQLHGAGAVAGAAGLCRGTGRQLRSGGGRCPRRCRAALKDHGVLRVDASGVAHFVQASVECGWMPERCSYQRRRAVRCQPLRGREARRRRRAVQRARHTRHQSRLHRARLRDRTARHWRGVRAVCLADRRPVMGWRRDGPTPRRTGGRVALRGPAAHVSWRGRPAQSPLTGRGGRAGRRRRG